MNEPQPSKMEQLRQSFVKIIRHKQDIELEVIKLLKNPAATGAQIMEAREAMLGVEEPLGRAVRKLREKYPYLSISYAPRPWHKPEFDKYMEVKNDQKIKESNQGNQEE
jgi:hypothetical protein